MGVIGLVARVFFVLLLAGKVSQESCPVISEQGVALLGYTFESFISSEFWECYRMCRDEIQCWSLNYHLESRRCDLNSETRERQPSKSVRRDSIVYFDDRKAHNKGILRSCKDLEVLAGRRSGEYWIDPEANRTLVKEYCYFDIAGYGSCENITSKVDGAYVLDINGDRVEVWCQMTNLTGCDPGKWTLAAKVDGKKARISVSREWFLVLKN
ncbi:uncharacterized protein LOC116611659 [Nematostella vectensis]|uniref:uncharacterized protein LOC116611659 n=1 Tax=Nematostella vectensis TaxID=45351 RepID=UPI00138FA51C|nr:uncharacterized protein LOC116611659 [Nematostella vectensis]